MSLHELFDARGGIVETDRQTGDFVAAFDGDARGEVATAESLDALLQAFEAPGQPTHDGVGAGSDRECQQRKRRPGPDRSMHRAHRAADDQPAVICELERVRRRTETITRFATFTHAGVPANPMALVFIESWRWNRAARTRENSASFIEQRKVRFSAGACAFERLLHLSR